MSSAKYKKGLYSLLCIICAFLLTMGETVAQEAPYFAWQHIKNGLSHNWATIIKEDQKGYLWVGTYGGLNRYDGTSFQTFEHVKGDPRSLPGNEIRAILEDRTGEIWVGTNDGLAHFNRFDQKFDVWRQEENNDTGLASPFVTSLLERNNGELWIGSTGGINALNVERNQLSNIKFEEHGSIPITGLFQDNKNRIWIGSELNVFLYYPDTNVLRIVNDEKGEPIISGFSEMIQAQNGHFWLTTGESGASRLEEVEEGFFAVLNLRKSDDPKKSIGNNRVNAIYEGKNGLIWLAPENEGMVIYNPASEEIYRYKSDKHRSESISSNSIWEIYEDKAERIWLGYFNKAISLSDHSVGNFHMSTKA